MSYDMFHLAGDLKKEDAKGTVEAALKLLKDANMLKHQLVALKPQFATKPKMRRLLEDPREQKDLLDIMSQLYAYVYTDEELREIRMFYITSTGQNMLKNALALGLRAGMILQDWVADLMDKAEELGDEFEDIELSELNVRDNKGDE